MRAKSAMLVTVCVLAGAAWARGGDDVPGVSDAIADRAIVRMQPGVSLGQFVAAFEADHPEVTLGGLESLAARRLHLLEVSTPPGHDLDQLEIDLTQNYLAWLQWGELLYENEAPEGQTGSTFVDFVATAADYQSQYAKAQLGLGDAHQLSTGRGTVVAVLDTGTDVDHPALAGRVVAGGFNFVQGTTDIRDVGDGLDSDADGLVDEMTGHGTFVAGLIALAAPEAKILPVRVLDGDGIGDAWTLTKGIYFAVDRGVEVINLSLGSTYKSDAVDDAIEEAETLGIPTVAAAGNLDRSDPAEFPAMSTKGLGVSAVDEGDLKADFSNFHDKIFISAPGATAFIGGEGGRPDLARAVISTIPGGGYAVWEGTSMATPLVASALALVRAQYPQPQWDGSEAMHDLLLGALEQTAVDIDPLNPAHAGELGVGRVDVAAAVGLGPPEPPLGDLNGDGVVDVQDLIRVITDWGLVHSSADLSGDGVVNTPDLILVLLNWS